MALQTGLGLAIPICPKGLFVRRWPIYIENDTELFSSTFKSLEDNCTIQCTMLLPSTVRSWIYLRLILIFLDVCSGGYTQRSTLFKVMSVEETLPDSAIQCAARSAAEDIRHSLMNSDGVCELLKSGQTGNTTNPSVFLRKTYAKFDYHPEVFIFLCKILLFSFYFSENYIRLVHIPLFLQGR